METLHVHVEELPQNSPSDLDAEGQENPANNYKIMAQIEELESKFDHNLDGRGLLASLSRINIGSVG